MADPDNSTRGKSPAFQFYPQDFISDPNVAAMTLTERGAYITLLCFCWSQGFLPSDHGRLARLCGISRAAFDLLWPALMVCFRVDGTDRLIQPRLERERQKQIDYRLIQAEKGRASGRARVRRQFG